MELSSFVVLWWQLYASVRLIHSNSYVLLFCSAVMATVRPALKYVVKLLDVDNTSVPVTVIEVACLEYCFKLEFCLL